jgi:DNA-binding transcriptional regulator YdaS (Cro superfamily)
MTPIERLVEHFGGQTKTAVALGVTQAAVSYWVTGAYAMSAKTAFKAEELTGGLITARELCAEPKPSVSAA